MLSNAIARLKVGKRKGKGSNKMKKVEVYKAEVDNLIRLTKKFWKTGDADFLGAIKGLTVKSEYDSCIDYDLTEIVESMATIVARFNGTYKQVYQSLEAFGVTIIGLDSNANSDMQGVE